MRITHFTAPLLTLLFLISLTTLSGCSVLSYYGQSVKGQLSILYNRESIEDIIADPKQDDALKLKLKSVKEIREYASLQLQLPNNKSYLYYTDLHRPYVVWNVFAAPEFSLKPITWCYPIVGCVSYRGYFDENNAIDYANDLSTSGNDIYVAGIAAYSTLGWFDDPLLSSMIQWRERSLAGLIFHELSHQILYVPDETGFNEAFASAVERIGSIQWLLEKKPSEVKHYISYLQAQNDFRHLLDVTKKKLNSLYESNSLMHEKQAQKIAIFNNLESEYQLLKQNWPSNIQFDYWFKTPINNARFTASLTYLELIPAFYTIFIEADGDWTAFYDEVITIGKLEKGTREKLLSSKLQDKLALDAIIDLLSREK